MCYCTICGREYFDTKNIADIRLCPDCWEKAKEEWEKNDE